MLDQQFVFSIELTRSGEILEVLPVEAGSLQTIREDISWSALRQGLAGSDRARLRWDIRPVFADGGARVKALQVSLSETGSPAIILDRLYDLEVLVAPVRDLVSRLVEEKRLASKDEIGIAVRAREAPPPNPGGPRVTLRRAPLRIVEAVGAAPLEPIEVLNAGARDERDHPVTIRRAALESAKAFSRSGGDRESGAFFIGRLVRLGSPGPEIAACIEEALEARHAVGGTYSLALSAETYLDLERELASRRRDPGGADLLLLGTAHGHNFLPSLEEGNGAGCPACPRRESCDLDSAFSSDADRRFHAAVFAKRPFGVALVWGFDARGVDVLRAYGFREGALRERALSVVA
jgi:hypothetical protein